MEVVFDKDAGEENHLMHAMLESCQMLRQPPLSIKESHRRPFLPVGVNFIAPPPSIRNTLELFSHHAHHCSLVLRSMNSKHYMDFAALSFDIGLIFSVFLKTLIRFCIFHIYCYCSVLSFVLKHPLALQFPLELKVFIFQ